MAEYYGEDTAAIQIMFSVSGGSTLKAGSGALIEKQLNNIIDLYNRTKGPRVNIRLNYDTFKKELQGMADAYDVTINYKPGINDKSQKAFMKSRFGTTGDEANDMLEAENDLNESIEKTGEKLLTLTERYAKLFRFVKKNKGNLELNQIVTAANRGVEELKTQMASELNSGKYTDSQKKSIESLMRTRFNEERYIPRDANLARENSNRLAHAAFSAGIAKSFANEGTAETKAGFMEMYRDFVNIFNDTIARAGDTISQSTREEYLELMDTLGEFFNAAIEGSNIKLEEYKDTIKASGDFIADVVSDVNDSAKKVEHQRAMASLYSRADTRADKAEVNATEALGRSIEVEAQNEEELHRQKRISIHDIEDQVKADKELIKTKNEGSDQDINRAQGNSPFMMFGQTVLENFEEVESDLAVLLKKEKVTFADIINNVELREKIFRDPRGFVGIPEQQAIWRQAYNGETPDKYWKEHNYWREARKHEDTRASFWRSYSGIMDAGGLGLKSDKNKEKFEDLKVQMDNEVQKYIDYILQDAKDVYDAHNKRDNLFKQFENTIASSGLPQKASGSLYSAFEKEIELILDHIYELRPEFRDQYKKQAEASNFTELFRWIKENDINDINGNNSFHDVLLANSPIENRPAAEALVSMVEDIIKNLPLILQGDREQPEHYKNISVYEIAHEPLNKIKTGEVCDSDEETKKALMSKIFTELNVAIIEEIEKYGEGLGGTSKMFFDALMEKVNGENGIIDKYFQEMKGNYHYTYNKEGKENEDAYVKDIYKNIKDIAIQNASGPLSQEQIQILRTVELYISRAFDMMRYNRGRIVVRDNNMYNQNTPNKATVSEKNNIEEDQMVKALREAFGDDLVVIGDKHNGTQAQQGKVIESGMALIPAINAAAKRLDRLKATISLIDKDITTNVSDLMERGAITEGVLTDDDKFKLSRDTTILAEEIIKEVTAIGISGSGDFGNVIDMYLDRVGELSASEKDKAFLYELLDAEKEYFSLLFQKENKEASLDANRAIMHSAYQAQIVSSEQDKNGNIHIVTKQDKIYSQKDTINTYNKSITKSVQKYTKDEQKAVIAEMSEFIKNYVELIENESKAILEGNDFDNTQFNEAEKKYVEIRNRALNDTKIAVEDIKPFEGAYKAAKAMRSMENEYVAIQREWNNAWEAGNATRAELHNPYRTSKEEDEFFKARRGMSTWSGDVAAAFFDSGLQEVPKEIKRLLNGNIKIDVESIGQADFDSLVKAYPAMGEKGSKIYKAIESYNLSIDKYNEANANRSGDPFGVQEALDIQKYSQNRLSSLNADYSTYLNALVVAEDDLENERHSLENTISDLLHVIYGTGSGKGTIPTELRKLVKNGKIISADLFNEIQWDNFKTLVPDIEDYVTRYNNCLISVANKEEEVQKRERRAVAARVQIEMGQDDLIKSNVGVAEALATQEFSKKNNSTYLKLLKNVRNYISGKGGYDYSSIYQLFNSGKKINEDTLNKDGYKSFLNAFPEMSDENSDLSKAIKKYNDFIDNYKKEDGDYDRLMKDVKEGVIEQISGRGVYDYDTLFHAIEDADELSEDNKNILKDLLVGGQNTNMYLSGNDVAWGEMEKQIIGAGIAAKEIRETKLETWLKDVRIEVGKLSKVLDEFTQDERSLMTKDGAIKSVMSLNNDVDGKKAFNQFFKVYAQAQKVDGIVMGATDFANRFSNAISGLRTTETNIENINSIPELVETLSSKSVSKLASVNWNEDETRLLTGIRTKQRRPINDFYENLEDMLSANETSNITAEQVNSIESSFAGLGITSEETRLKVIALFSELRKGVGKGFTWGQLTATVQKIGIELGNYKTEADKIFEDIKTVGADVGRVDASADKSFNNISSAVSELLRELNGNGTFKDGKYVQNIEGRHIENNELSDIYNRLLDINTVLEDIEANGGSFDPVISKMQELHDIMRGYAKGRSINYVGSSHIQSHILSMLSGDNGIINSSREIQLSGIQYGRGTRDNLTIKDVEKTRDRARQIVGELEGIGGDEWLIETARSIANEANSILEARQKAENAATGILTVSKEVEIRGGLESDEFVSAVNSAASFANDVLSTDSIYADSMRNMAEATHDAVSKIGEDAENKGVVGNVVEEVLSVKEGMEGAADKMKNASQIFEASKIVRDIITELYNDPVAIEMSAIQNRISEDIIDKTKEVVGKLFEDLNKFNETESPEMIAEMQKHLEALYGMFAKKSKGKNFLDELFQGLRPAISLIVEADNAMANAIATAKKGSEEIKNITTGNFANAVPSAKTAEQQKPDEIAKGADKGTAHISKNFNSANRVLRGDDGLEGIILKEDEWAEGVVQGILNERYNLNEAIAHGIISEGVVEWALDRTRIDYSQQGILDLQEQIINWAAKSRSKGGGPRQSIFAGIMSGLLNQLRENIFTTEEFNQKVPEDQRRALWGAYDFDMQMLNNKLLDDNENAIQKIDERAKTAAESYAKSLNSFQNSTSEMQSEEGQQINLLETDRESLRKHVAELEEQSKNGVIAAGLETDLSKSRELLLALDQFDLDVGEIRSKYGDIITDVTPRGLVFNENAVSGETIDEINKKLNLEKEVLDIDNKQTNARKEQKDSLDKINEKIKNIASLNKSYYSDIRAGRTNSANANKSARNEILREVQGVKGNPKKNGLIGEYIDKYGEDDGIKAAKEELADAKKILKVRGDDYNLIEAKAAKEFEVALWRKQYLDATRELIRIAGKEEIYSNKHATAVQRRDEAKLNLLGNKEDGGDVLGLLNEDNTGIKPGVISQYKKEITDLDKNLEDAVKDAEVKASNAIKKVSMELYNLEGRAKDYKAVIDAIYTERNEALQNYNTEEIKGFSATILDTGRDLDTLKQKLTSGGAEPLITAEDKKALLEYIDLKDKEYNTTKAEKLRPTYDALNSVMADYITFSEKLAQTNQDDAESFRYFSEKVGQAAGKIEKITGLMAGVISGPDGFNALSKGLDPLSKGIEMLFDSDVFKSFSTDQQEKIMTSLDKFRDKLGEIQAARNDKSSKQAAKDIAQDSKEIDRLNNKIDKLLTKLKQTMSQNVKLTDTNAAARKTMERANAIYNGALAGPNVASTVAKFEKAYSSGNKYRELLQDLHIIENEGYSAESIDRLKKKYEGAIEIVEKFADVIRTTREEAGKTVEEEITANNNESFASLLDGVKSYETVLNSYVNGHEKILDAIQKISAKNTGATFRNDYAKMYGRYERKYGERIKSNNQLDALFYDELGNEGGRGLNIQLKEGTLSENSFKTAFGKISTRFDQRVTTLEKIYEKVKKEENLTQRDLESLSGIISNDKLSTLIDLSKQGSAKVGDLISRDVIVGLRAKRAEEWNTVPVGETMGTKEFDNAPQIQEITRLLQLLNNEVTKKNIAKIIKDFGNSAIPEVQEIVRELQEAPEEVLWKAENIFPKEERKKLKIAIKEARSDFSLLNKFGADKLISTYDEKTGASYLDKYDKKYSDQIKHEVTSIAANGETITKSVYTDLGKFVNNIGVQRSSGALSMDSYGREFDNAKNAISTNTDKLKELYSLLSKGRKLSSDDMNKIIEIYSGESSDNTIKSITENIIGRSAFANTKNGGYRISELVSKKELKELKSNIKEGEAELKALGNFDRGKLFSEEGTFTESDWTSIWNAYQKTGIENDILLKKIKDLHRQVGTQLNSKAYTSLTDDITKLVTKTGTYKDLLGDLKSLTADGEFSIAGFNDILSNEKYSGIIEMFEPLSEAMRGVSNEINKIPINAENFKKQLNSIGASIDPNDTAKLEQYNTVLEYIKKNLGDSDIITMSWLCEMLDNLKKMEGVGPEAIEMFEQIKFAAKDFSKDGLEAVAQQLDKDIREIEREFSDAAIENNKLLNKIKGSFETNVIQKISSTIMQTMTKQVKQIYTNIKNLDTSIAQLKIVSRDGSVATQEFADSVASAATKTATSVTSMVESITNYARLGYSVTEATKFAELTAEYSKIANIDTSTATTNITGIIKAFNVSANELESVLDKLIVIGNNFAISSSELGEGLNNAAAALVANGNTLEQSLGMLAAANATVQDVSRASTAVRTVAARVSNSTSELEELGEDTTELISTANLADEMEAFGVAIMDANGELLSTYDILDQVAEQWDSYSNTAQASIAALLAGTRQQAVFYSMIQNWDDAREAVEMCGDAAGELAETYDIYINTIEGRLAQLSASWEGFSQSIMGSELIKDLIFVLNGIVQGLQSAGKAIKDSGMIWVTILTLITNSIVNYASQARVAKKEQKELNAAQEEGMGKSKTKGFEKFFSIFNGSLRKQRKEQKALSKQTKKLNGDTQELAENEEEAGEKMGELDTSNLGTGVLVFIELIATAVGMISDLAGASESTTDFIVAGIMAAGVVIVAVIMGIEKTLETNEIIAMIAMIAMLLVSVINGFMNMESKAVKAVRETKEGLDDALESLEDMKDKLEDLQDEYDDLIDKIDELQRKVANGSITVGESADLSRYLEELNALQDELSTQELIVSIQEQATANLAQTYASQLTGTKGGAGKVKDLYGEDNAMGVKWKKSGLKKAGYSRSDINKMTTEELLVAMAKNYSKLTSGEQTWFNDQIAKLGEYADALYYTQEEIDAATDDAEKEAMIAANEAYNTYRYVLDEIDLALGASTDTKITNIIGRDTYSSARDTLNAISALNGEIASEIEEFSNLMADLSNDEIKDLLKKQGMNDQQVEAFFEQYGNDLEKIRAIVEGLSDEEIERAAEALDMGVDEFKKVMNSLTNDELLILAEEFGNDWDRVKMILDGIGNFDGLAEIADNFGYNIGYLTQTVDAALSDILAYEGMSDIVDYLQKLGLIGDLYDENGEAVLVADWKVNSSEDVVDLDREYQETMDSMGETDSGRPTITIDGKTYIADESLPSGDKYTTVDGTHITLDDFNKKVEDYITEYEKNRAELIEKHSREAAELYGDMTMLDLLQNYFENWSGEAYELTNYTVSCSSMLEDLDDTYSGLSSALSDIDDMGIVSSDTIQDLLENNKELVDEYFELTDQGYQLKKEWADMNSIDIMEDYAAKQVSQYVDVYQDALDAVEEAKQVVDDIIESGDAYMEDGITPTTEMMEALADVINKEAEADGALTNLNRYISSNATELRQEELDAITDELEAQVDALDEQLDRYSDLIDLRKDLLDTYKDEIDYQKSLAEKTKSVSDLETQLAVAQLDNSAAGLARQRELQSQLESAQEELNDFTLEQAIDRVVNQLDKEESEFEKAIDRQTQEIEDAIEDLAKRTTINITPEQDEEGRYTGEVTVSASYHTGGFVGGEINDNEEFAKLLKGEFVATPAMMQQFMDTTLPGIAEAAAATRNLGGNNFYSPLITLNCEGITTEAIPSMEKIVKRAVSEVEKHIDSGFSRAGRNTRSLNLSL